MRRFQILFAAFLLSIAVAPVSHAAPISVTGSLVLEIDVLNPLNFSVNDGNPFEIDVASDGSFTLPSGVLRSSGEREFAINYGAIDTITATFSNRTAFFGHGLNASKACPGGGNGACVGGSGFGGDLYLDGNLYAYSAPNSTLFNWPMPVFGHLGSHSGITFSVFGQPLTTGVAMVTGGIHPATLTGHDWDDGLNVDSSLMLVSASYLRQFGFIDVPLTTTFTLTIVGDGTSSAPTIPEPGAALLFLLGTAFAGFAIRSRA